MPFSMGPLGSPLSSYGIQLTDSPYVTQSMRIMTRMGSEALEHIGAGSFVRWLVGWLLSFIRGWLVQGWFKGWLVGWFKVGWLVGDTTVGE